MSHDLQGSKTQKKIKTHLKFIDEGVGKLKV